MWTINSSDEPVNPQGIHDDQTPDQTKFHHLSTDSNTIRWSPDGYDVWFVLKKCSKKYRNTENKAKNTKKIPSKNKNYFTETTSRIHYQLIGELINWTAEHKFPWLFPQWLFISQTFPGIEGDLSHQVDVK